MYKSAAKLRLVLLVVVLMLAVEAASVSEVHGDYKVSITRSSVSVNITTLFTQNLTTVQLPSYKLSLTGFNASAATSTLSAALNQLVAGASVSTLTMTSISTSNSTRNDLSFNVNGVESTANGGLRVNMAWKSFDVTSDITSGNLSLNLVGSYLSNSSILRRSSTGILTFSYSEDGSAISSAGSVQAASSFNLLDFSGLSATLETWPRSFNLTNGGTTILTNTARHNMTISESFSEGGTPVTAVYLAAYSHVVEVTVNGSGTVIGNNIFLDANDSVALAMAGIIVASLVIGSSVILVEWQVNKSGRYKTRKKDRPAQKK